MSSKTEKDKIAEHKAVWEQIYKLRTERDAIDDKIDTLEKKANTLLDEMYD